MIFFKASLLREQSEQQLVSMLVESAIKLILAHGSKQDVSKITQNTKFTKLIKIMGINYFMLIPDLIHQDALVDI